MSTPYKDSEYGKISDLFAKLHFAGERGGTARPYSTLGKKTSDYRKNFIKTVLNQRPNAPTVYPFPLKYDHPDVQLCASTFLDSNHSIFQGTQDTPPGLLKYPEDKQEIVNLLAKILCNQELSHRKNQFQLKKSTLDEGDTINVGDDGTSSEERVVKRPRKSLTKDKDPQLLSFDDEDAAYGSDYAYSPRAKERVNAEASADPYLPHNTKVHLDIAYPAAGEVEGKDGSFLLVHGSTWPEDIWPFAFRFIHEQNAYKLRGSNHVRNFVAAAKQHLNLPDDLTQEENDRVSKKCGKFIANWISKWITFGLLVQKGEEVSRHSYFDEKLGLYRARWIAGVHQGSTKGVVELKTPSLPAQMNPLKRPASHSNLNRNTQGYEPSATKRAKIDSEDEDLRGAQMDGLHRSHGHSLPPVNHGHASHLLNRSRESTGTGELPILADSTAPSSISSRQVPSDITKVEHTARFPPISTSDKQKGPAATQSTPTPLPETVQPPRAKTFSSRTFSSFPTSDSNGASFSANQPGAPSKAGTEVSQSGPTPSLKGPRPSWAVSKSSSRPQSAVNVASPSLPTREQGGITNSTHSLSSMTPSLPTRVAEPTPTTQPGFDAATRAGQKIAELTTAPQTSSAQRVSHDQSWVSRSTPNHTGSVDGSFATPFDGRVPDFVRRVGTPSNTDAVQAPKSEESMAHQSSAPKPQKPAVASLRIIIEQSEGEMNFDNPMSESDLSFASFADFMEGVRSRRANPQDAIRVLKFKQRWGANKIYVVEQNTSDEVWKKVRNEIKRNFETMKDKKPDRKKFEVDVLVEGDEDDDDDGDE